MSRLPKSVRDAEKRIEEYDKEVLKQQDADGKTDDQPTGEGVGQEAPEQPEQTGKDEQTEDPKVEPEAEEQEEPQEKPAAGSDDGVIAEDISPTSEKKPGEDFRHKYEVLQGKYNKELALMRNELNGEKARTKGLEILLSKLDAQSDRKQQKQPEKRDESIPLVDPSKYEDYDEPVKDLAAKYNRLANYVRQYGQQNEQRWQQAGQRIQHVGSQSQQIMLEKFKQQISEEFPGWEQLDNHPEFSRWINDADPETGFSRKAMLDSYGQRQDHKRFASLLKKAANDVGLSRPQRQVGNGRKPSLEAQIAPDTSRVDHVPQGEKTVKRSDIKKFYDDLSRGKLKRLTEKEINKREHEIERAVVEGRVVEG